jgi:hypothetical protein
MAENDPYEIYEEVPREYNLIGAPPEKLDLYGIPPKPDAIAESGLFEFWQKLVSPPFSTKRPTFGTLDAVSRTERRESMLVPSSGGTVESSLNWSGAVVFTCWPKRFVLATAGWVAPKVSPPAVEPLFTEPPPKSMIWVGLDGHNGRLPKISLPQIGTAHWLADGQPQHFAWSNWWSQSATGAVTPIDDFAIAAGDEILAGLAVLISEDVLFFIKNQSTGEFRSFLAKRQPLGDIEPLGSSAEWVMERPTAPIGRVLRPLAAYDAGRHSVDFKYCMALAADRHRPLAPGRLMTLADNGRMIKMREAFANPYRTFYVSRAKRRHDPDGSIGVTCTFHEPT